MMTRREAIKAGVLAGAAVASLPGALAQEHPVPMGQPLITTATVPFTLPPLPYAYDALEPHIDARTMEIHHDRHHAAYVANLNRAVTDHPDLGRMPIDDLMRHLSSVPENIRPAVRNNGGGHYNHSLFWQMLRQDGGGAPTGDLARALEAAFGNFNAFKDALTKAALGQFGSGWAWLVLDGKQLKIEPTANQDTPLSAGKTPLLGVDVWEHAYYLKYQNQRADYLNAWWNVVNWDFVSERYAKLKP